MLYKESWIFITDNTNIRWLKVFQLYKGFCRRVTKPGFFIKGSARIVEPPRIEYKGFKYKYNIKGDISRSLIVRSNRQFLFRDGLVFKWPDNSGIIIRKKQEPKSKFLNGSVGRNIKRRKFLSLFKVVL